MQYQELLPDRGATTFPWEKQKAPLVGLPSPHHSPTVFRALETAEI